MIKNINYMGDIMRIHMLGIKGTGMSSLAIILKQFGNVVTGSDYSYNSFTEEALKENDIHVSDFAITNVENIDLLIVGHLFMDTDNIELVEAHKLNIECREYNEALAHLIKDYYSIAISGSNGKTTTTGLLATILDSVQNVTKTLGMHAQSASGTMEKVNEINKSISKISMEAKSHSTSVTP